MAQTSSNRFKYLLASGGIVPGTTDIRALLLCGTGALSHTGVPDMNTVADALASFTECAVSGYSRKSALSFTAAEDDTNDWALIDCIDVAYGTLSPGGNPIVGEAFYTEGGGTDATRLLLSVHDLTSTPPNGGTFTATTTNGVAKLT